MSVSLSSSSEWPPPARPTQTSGATWPSASTCSAMAASCAKTPYSFTSDLRWVNHEWLWDVVVAATYRSGGLPAVVTLRAALIAVVLWTVGRSTRTAPEWVRLATIALVAVGCVSQWRSTRPQLASLALYALLLPRISDCGCQDPLSRGRISTAAG